MANDIDLLSEENTGREPYTHERTVPAEEAVKVQDRYSQAQNENEGTFGKVDVIEASSGKEKNQEYASEVEDILSSGRHVPIPMPSSDKKPVASAMEEAEPEKKESPEKGNEIVHFPPIVVRSGSTSPKPKSPSREPPLPKGSEKILLLGSLSDLPVIWTTVGSLKAVSVSELKNAFAQIELLRNEKSRLGQLLAKTQDDATRKAQKSAEQLQAAEEQCRTIQEESARDRAEFRRMQAEAEAAKWKLVSAQKEPTTEKPRDEEPIRSALKEALMNSSRGKARKTDRAAIRDGAELERLKKLLVEADKQAAEMKANYEAQIAQLRRDLPGETRIMQAAESHSVHEKRKHPSKPSSVASTIQSLFSDQAGLLLMRIGCEIFKLRTAVAECEDKAASTAVENLTQLFESECMTHAREFPKEGDTFSGIIDSVMLLSELVVPRVQDKRKAMEALDEVSQKLFEGVAKIFGAGSSSSPEKRDATSVPEEDEKGEPEPEVEVETEKDQEVYWSDFSDEDCEEDDREDMIAVSTAAELQKWITSSRLTSAFIAQTHDRSKRGRVSPSVLLQTIQEAGCEMDPSAISALIKRLELGPDSSVDYAKFVADLSKRDVAWWAEYIHNNSFEQRNRVSRQGNIATLAWPGLFSFVRKTVARKIGALPGREAMAEELLQEGNGPMSKSEFRKFCLAHKLPLSREDTRVLMSVLDKDMEGAVRRERLAEFLGSPDLPTSSARESAAVNKQEKDQQKSLQHAESLQEIYARIAEFVMEQRLDLGKVFRFYDHSHNGRMAFDSFMSVAQENRLPANPFELRLVFDAVKEPQEDVVDYNEFVEKINDLCAVAAEAQESAKSAGPVDLAREIGMSVRDLRFRLAQSERENVELRKQLTAVTVKSEMLLASSINMRQQQQPPQDREETDENNAERENVSASAEEKSMKQQAKTQRSERKPTEGMGGAKTDLSARLMSMRASLSNQ